MNCFEYICHCLLLIYLESKIWECAAHADVFVWDRARRTESIVYANGSVYLKYNMYNALDAIKSNARDGRDTRDDCCTLYLLTLLIRNLSTFMSMNYIRKFVRTSLHSNDSQGASQWSVCVCFVHRTQSRDINHVAIRREGCIVCGGTQWNRIRLVSGH